MLNKIKGKLIYIYNLYNINKQVRKLNISKEKQNIFVLQTPTHTNIGDHVIAEAQFTFLNKKFPQSNLIEVNQSLLDYFIESCFTKVSKEDLIFIHGGGNFGNQYLREENWRRKIIKSFPNNKIISFPQTIYYTDNKQGKEELATTQNIINSHNNLTLIAREEVSFNLMKEYFPKTKVILTPDIVLSLEKTQPELARKGILMVLRGDEEKILNSEQHKNLDKIANKYFDKITYSDMHYHKNVQSKEDRDEVLDFKFNQFKKSEIVITDRLHGMVLAAITGTPCIAFSNYNQKVSGTYEWIKDLNYIRFISPNEDVEKHVLELKDLETKTIYNPVNFEQEFQQIVNIIYGS